MAQRGRIEYGMPGLGEALGAREYEVPIYQRSYAWRDEVVRDFFDDLLKALNAKEPDYFLGSLVLAFNDASGRTTVIDGQQRLATTSLFLGAIRDAFRERGSTRRADEIHRRFLATLDRDTERDVPRLLLNEDDQVYFARRLLNGEVPEAKLESHERIGRAAELLRASLADDVQGYGAQAGRRLLDWWDFVERKATVITVTVPTEADAFVIFEALNARGEGLTIGDMLKNLLFMHAGRRLNGVRAAWMNALRALDVTAENEDFVTFLRHQWTSTHGRPVRERDLYRAIREGVASQAQAVEYAMNLETGARLYAAILSSSHAFWADLGVHADTARGHIETLQRLKLEQNRPLLLAVMQYFTKAELRKTLRALVSWGVRGLIVGGIGGGRTEAAYASVARKVRQGEVRTAKAVFAELASVIPADDVFEREFATARQNRAGIVRYLLLALERGALRDSQPEFVPNARADAVNLEHILPRNPANSSWSAFRSDERSHWAYRLGNQVLMRERANRSLGNREWTVKRPELARSAFRLTRTAAREGAWGKAEIERQQRRMARLAVAVWPREP